MKEKKWIVFTFSGKRTHFCEKSTKEDSFQKKTGTPFRRHSCSPGKDLYYLLLFFINDD